VSADRILQRVWYERAPLALFLLLLPLSIVFGVLCAARRFLYRLRVLHTVRVARPVLVVGNVSVGGTGKTPLVIWLAEKLASRGCRVGIVTRGYGGRAAQWPQDVTQDASPGDVGDEAVLLALRTQAAAGTIVVAGPDRVAAAKRAIERGAEIILSDDGLQHYRLGRDAEIVVIDAARRFGNGWLLPAGPLREPRSRVRRANLIVESARGGGAASDAASDELSASNLVSVQDLHDAINIRTGERRALAAFAGMRMHAVAAIGHPEAFFAMLRAHGIAPQTHPLPDHAPMSSGTLDFGDDAPVLMTEKDAVKCRAFANERHWAVPLGVTFGDADERRLNELLDTLIRISPATRDSGGGS
jgi:tetraacyldisaccharide 4'-kinase